MDGAKDKTPAEILTEARKYIPGAYAVRPLRSGDADVMVPDQTAKDRAMARIDIEEFKILRQDYLVEIPGVPYTLKVENGRGARNDALLQEICNATKKIVPGIAINQVRWLHAPETQEIRGRPAQSRGTLILYLPTEAVQRKIVEKGIILDAQVFDARLSSYSI